MRIQSLALLSIGAGLVVGVPHVRRDPADDVDPEDPSKSNPKTAPTSFPSLPKADNPFPNGIKKVPDECTNFQKVSEDCHNALDGVSTESVSAYGGGLLFQDGSCNDDQKAALETAAWDALTLAQYTGDRKPTNARQIAAWKTYVGPDYSIFQQRMLDNFNRFKDFKKDKKFDIITSCKDTKGWCGKEIDGKGVGGYAWTYHGWTGWYHYITLCPNFFGLDTFEEKIEFIEDQIQKGDFHYAEEAEWLKNQGQFFLHEMMHLDSIGQPHVKDEYVSSEEIGPKAYGPRLVYKLAQRAIKSGGGATRGSTNADTYSWLSVVNYFWDLTGYFPKPPNWKVTEAEIDNIGSGEEARAVGPVSVYIGDVTESTTDSDMQAAFDKFMEGMDTPAPPATTPAPDDGVPAPSCATEGTKFPQPPVEDFITSFCSDKRFWDTMIVPPISTGTGQTSDGKGKAMGVEASYDLPGTSDKLWLELAFATDSCTGSFLFAQGTDDASKIEHCRARFRTALNGCQTGTIDEKLGGTVRDVCAVYAITARPEGEDPFNEEEKDNGDFTCKETDTSQIGGADSPLAGTCTCWYSNSPGLTDVFKMPSSGNCKDTNKADLLNN
ncbi:hypothetical protein GTA08_BOTSDO08340 [Botryosphaeria dothidea]|uniref:Metalloprotease protein n=1 Tax=Botryosphaeria dothidea TaxID=55169 RepID=A0A8H4IP01_9PEZI|nr:hypothetical protein GTA08_BOTSDO08340 [Botryosphaeria dothidea]